jgi:hypothetical protein
MNKIRLFSTAAALLLIAGTASAQELKKNETPSPAPAAQQKAPAEKVAPNMHAGDRKLPETTGQSPKSVEPAKDQSMDKGPMDKGAMDKTERTDKKPEATPAHTKSNDSAQMKANDKAGTAQTNDAAKSNESAAGKSNATTGQGAAAGAAKLTTEQRTKITTIIKEQKVQPVHLNVSISVGTRVPESVHFYPVPVEVVNIYPEWRGYDYILVGDEIVIVDPHTHEIVAIVEA